MKKPDTFVVQFQDKESLHHVFKELPLLSEG